MTERLKSPDAREATLKAVDAFFEAVPREACREYVLGETKTTVGLFGITHRTTVTDKIVLPMDGGRKFEVDRELTATKILGRALIPKQDVKIIKTFDRKSGLPTPTSWLHEQWMFNSRPGSALHVFSRHYHAESHLYHLPGGPQDDNSKDWQPADYHFSEELESIQRDLQVALSAAEAHTATP